MEKEEMKIIQTLTYFDASENEQRNLWRFYR